jgi:hypothetical protein
MSRRRAWTTVGLSSLLLVAGVAALRVEHTHQQSWEWRWNPSPAPPKVTFEGRDYSRGQALATLPPGAVRLGTTPGGGVVFGPPRPHPHAPTVLEVRSGEHLMGYALMGGP